MYDIEFRRQFFKWAATSLVASVVMAWATGSPVFAVAVLFALVAWLVSVWALARAAGGITTAWVVLLSQVFPVIGMPLAFSMFWKTRTAIVKSQS